MSKRTSELRELNIDELNKQAETLRHDLMLARIAKATQQLKNPLKVRDLRRDIARILTIINEKGEK